MDGAAVPAEGDLYSVLGVEKECTDAELRVAYKKMAMKWHPDRCGMAGNSSGVEEAKSRFQEIQAAYSVLSDTNKRFLYDVGVYDGNDDDHNSGMAEFMSEMMKMMSQCTSTVGVDSQETIEDLQMLFTKNFQTDLDTGFNEAWLCSDQSKGPVGEPSATADGTTGRNKRCFSVMNTVEQPSCLATTTDGMLETAFQTDDLDGRTGLRRKLSTKHVIVELNVCGSKRMANDQGRSSDVM